MSFLDKVGLAFGVGTAKIDVWLGDPEGPISGGTMLRGVVRPQGGKLDQTGRLLVRIQEHWTTTTYNAATKTTTTQHHYRNYSETVLAPELTLKAETPGDEFRYSLVMPWDGLLSHDWSVSALFDVPGVGDAGAIAKFPLSPPPPIRGLVTALQAVAPFNPKTIFNNGTQYRADLRPTERSAADFDGVRFVVVLDAARDIVAGNLLINPQERTLMEHAQSLLHLNNRSEKILFSASALANGADPAAAEPDRDILAQLRTLLYPGR